MNFEITENRVYSNKLMKLLVSSPALCPPALMQTSQIPPSLTGHWRIRSVGGGQQALSLSSANFPSNLCWAKTSCIPSRLTLLVQCTKRSTSLSYTDGLESFHTSFISSTILWSFDINIAIPLIKVLKSPLA